MGHNAGCIPAECARICGCDAQSSDEDIGEYREFDSNEGLAPYFREEVRKKMQKWSLEQQEAGHEYNIYTDGLKIYTTLDYKMQQWAEAAMREHMTSLQQQFEESYGKNAPWLTDEKWVKKVVRATDIYKNHQEIRYNLHHNQRIGLTLIKSGVTPLFFWSSALSCE